MLTSKRNERTGQRHRQEAMTVIVLSLSHIPADGRVRRHCEVLTAAGHRVLAIGLSRADGGTDKLGPETASVHLTLPPVGWSLLDRLKMALLIAARGPLSERQKFSLAGCVPGVRAMDEALDAIVRRELATEPDAHRYMVLANDWTTLPAALAAQQRHGVSFHYDTHELATEEHADSWRWRVLFPPVVRVVEALGVRQAQSVSCVSPGIAALLADAYGCPQLPHALMSVPTRPPLPPRPVGQPVIVLYHGLFTPNRGLGALIASAEHWPADMRLVLRGRANDDHYNREIANLAASGIASGRVSIEPMVPYETLLAVTNEADVGVFLPDLSLKQNQLALPNKLFEYLFAGLAPIVPVGTEMAILLQHENAGLIITDTDAGHLSKFLAGLTAERIMKEKEAAHRAALSLYRASQQTTIASLLQPPGAQW